MTSEAKTVAKRKAIKFSHHYDKLRVAEPDFIARLLSVQLVNLEELPQSFLDYDTDNGKYELPKRGTYLLLIFTTHKGMFTTLRSALQKHKVDYYTDSVGEEFFVHVSPSS